MYFYVQCCAPCLRGDKFICLAITEPAAGSDVANIQTTAVKSPCGKFYIVNGEKKWMSVVIVSLSLSRSLSLSLSLSFSLSLTVTSLL